MSPERLLLSSRVRAVVSARGVAGALLTLVLGSAGAWAAGPAPAVVPADAAEILGAVREPGAGAVVVNLWATWCVPCVDEFPDLLRLRRDYADRGLRLVLVSLDFGEGRDERVRGFLRGQGVDFRSFVKRGGGDAFVGRLDPGWSGILPATLIYDASGTRRVLIEGQTSYARLVEVITPLLAHSDDHAGNAAITRSQRG